MKQKMRLFCSLMLVGILCTFGQNTAYAQQEVVVKESVYSVLPGTKEWDALETVQNKKEACRIAVDTLEEMTDAELIQATLEYPFLVEIFLYNDYATGVQSVCDDCDALKELLSRDTASGSLVSFMESRVAGKYNSISGKEAVENEAIMAIMAYNEEICVALDDEEIEIINSYSSNIRVKTEQNTGARIAYIYTPNGSQVAHEQNTCNHPSGYHGALDDYTETTFGVTLISPGTCAYNCHSYAWYSTSTSNSFWIPNPMIYMTDGSYSQVMSGMYSNSISAQSGDKVFYGTAANIVDSHSAILVSSPSVYALGSRMARSKWGHAGVFEHAVSNVPSEYLDSQLNVSVWR